MPLSLSFSALPGHLLTDFSEGLPAPWLFEEKFIITYNVSLKFSWSPVFSNLGFHT